MSLWPSVVKVKNDNCEQHGHGTHYHDTTEVYT
jgi:hypothetical protein